MTDYNDGKWHRWDNGSRPIDSRSKVDFLTREGMKTDWVAGNCIWGDTCHPILAFRVTEEYKEPREFWLLEIDGGTTIALESDVGDCIHVREVLE